LTGGPLQAHKYTCSLLIWDGTFSAANGFALVGRFLFTSRLLPQNFIVQSKIRASHRTSLRSSSQNRPEKQKSQMAQSGRFPILHLAGGCSKRRNGSAKQRARRFTISRKTERPH